MGKRDLKVPPLMVGCVGDLKLNGSWRSPDPEPTIWQREDQIEVTDTFGP